MVSFDAGPTEGDPRLAEREAHDRYGGKMPDKDPRWRSVFAPHQRRVMNGIPIMINLFVPWILFCVTFGIWSFKFHFRYPQFLPHVALVLFAVCLYPLWRLYESHQKGQDPMWYGYSFVTLSLAVGLGIYFGNWNYESNMWYSFKYNSMENYPSIDVGKELAVNVLDAGRVYFASTAKIDTAQSWHFKDGTLYCVAPIVSSAGMQTKTLDFWAVGTDCCSDIASDFRCGEFTNANARSGLRLLDESKLKMYRLAVEQATQLYNIHSTNPLFFEWTQDPLDDVQKFQIAGWSFFQLGVVFSLVASVLIVGAATLRFAYIGRTPKKHDESDDENPSHTKETSEDIACKHCNFVGAEIGRGHVGRKHRHEVGMNADEAASKPKGGLFSSLFGGP
jgi:hypothetical protein